MKHKLQSIALVSSIVVAGFAIPMVAQAGEVSYNLGLGNFYLWRGLNSSGNAPQIHGGLQYDDASGFYAGAWLSNNAVGESLTGSTGSVTGHEYDLYAGFSGKAGDISYDISYWMYIYPENAVTDGTITVDSLSDTDYADIVLSGSYGPATIAAYIGVDSDRDDDKYITISGTQDKYTLTYGFWDREKPKTADEYSHIQLSYAASDNLSLTISIADSDLGGASKGGVEEDPLFHIGYNVPLQ